VRAELAKVASVDEYPHVSQSSIVTAETLLAGFDSAHGRVRSAAGGLDWAPMYFAVFEALNWAVSLDDRLGNRRTGIALEDDHLSGLRHARNRTHHQWANAFVFDTDVTGGLDHMVLGRAQLGRGHAEITWRVTKELPKPTDPAHSNPKQEQAYARALEARNVPESLETIATALAAAVASGT